MTPLVSILMPVYNGVRFVAKAINSVLAQDFQDWELIIVNDGSTDGTTGVLAGFADPRIRVIHQANAGEAAARNRGLEAIKSEYVAFLDADDLYLPNALADMTAFLEEHQEFEAVRCDGYFCDENDQPLGRISEVRPEVPSGNILEELIVNPAVVGPPLLVMVRHACLLETGVRFDGNLVMGPDWDFWIHLARHARFGLLDRLTCMYRVHQTNITRTIGAKRRKTNLVQGRMKVISSGWFQELSLGARRRLFHNLLVSLLDGDDEQQQTVMETPAFQALPADIRADLLRLVASSYLIQGRQSGFAMTCLKQSLALQPDNRKSRAMLRLADVSPALVKIVLSAWQVLHRARTWIRTLGKRKIKAVPAALAPLSE